MIRNVVWILLIVAVILALIVIFSPHLRWQELYQSIGLILMAIVIGFTPYIR